MKTENLASDNRDLFRTLSNIFAKYIYLFVYLSIYLFICLFNITLI